MISSYRLGNLVILGLSENEENEILAEHPNSFGSRYILEKRCRPNYNNINLITKIVIDELQQYNKLLPKNISESTVIHLRLGDVVAGNEWHEKIKRPLEVNHIKTLLQNDTNPKYVIGKCFFAKPSSTNYEECVNLSNEYLNNVMNELQAEHFDSGNADVDLCCAIKSKLFVQGRGYFSKLIVEIRKKIFLNNIETITITN